MINLITEHSHFGIYGRIIEDNKILLVKQTIGAYNDMYDLPGGSPEYGEDNSQTLIREIKEETGLNVLKCNQLLNEVTTVFYEYELNNKKFLLKHSALLYDVERYTGELKTIHDYIDVSSAEFIKIPNIENYNVTPFVKKILSL